MISILESEFTNLHNNANRRVSIDFLGVPFYERNGKTVVISVENKNAFFYSFPESRVDAWRAGNLKDSFSCFLPFLFALKLHYNILNLKPDIFFFSFSTFHNLWGVFCLLVFLYDEREAKFFHLWALWMTRIKLNQVENFIFFLHWCFVFCQTFAIFYPLRWLSLFFVIEIPTKEFLTKQKITYVSSSYEKIFYEMKFERTKKNKNRKRPSFAKQTSRRH